MQALTTFVFFGAIQMSLLPGDASPILQHHDEFLSTALLRNHLPLPMKRAIKAHYFEDNMDDFNFMISFPNAWRRNTFQDQPTHADYINVIDTKVVKKRSTVLPISVFQKYLADTMSKIKLRL